MFVGSRQWQHASSAWKQLNDSCPYFVAEGGQSTQGNNKVGPCLSVCTCSAMGKFSHLLSTWISSKRGTREIIQQNEIENKKQNYRGMKDSENCEISPYSISPLSKYNICFLNMQRWIYLNLFIHWKCKCNSTYRNIYAFSANSNCEWIKVPMEQYSYIFKGKYLLDIRKKL